MKHLVHKERRGRHLLSAPVIYIQIIPLVCLDICMEVYHRICFPLYGISYISRKSYIRIDRQRLHYLNWVQKFNCMYCGYANGLLHYVSTIVAETEKYWCGIRHKNDPGQIFYPPRHQRDFLLYGDETSFRSLKKGRP